MDRERGVFCIETHCQNLIPTREGKEGKTEEEEEEEKEERVLGVVSVVRGQLCSLSEVKCWNGA